MLVGGKGVGKTSFLSLLQSTPTQHTRGTIPSLLSPPLPIHAQTPSSPTSPGPPITPSSVNYAYSPASSTSAPSPTTSSSPLPQMPRLQRPAPTTRLSASTITLDRPAEKIQLCLIDTPGLDLRNDDGPAMHARQRERGVRALLSVAEERFEEVLREESKVVRRQSSGGSGLIHLCVYLIDARAVLHTQEDEIEVDWSGLSITTDKASNHSPAMQNLRPTLAKVEVDIIRQLSERMNILPILTHADCLSTAELTAVRHAVRRDLAEDAEGEKRRFGLFELASTGECEPVDWKHTPSISSDKRAAPEVSRSSRPHTPMSVERQFTEGDETGLPYAIFAPSDGGTREYPWGTADTSTMLDLEVVREAILDTHAKALRVSTREVLYERYRIERLMAHRSKRGIANGLVERREGEESTR